MRAILPQLAALRKEEEEKPRIGVFEGVDELKLLYDDMLETKQHIAGIVPWEDWNHLLGRGFMEDFIERRTSHGLRMRLLAPRTPVAEELKNRDAHELRETRFTPLDIPMRTTMFLYGAKAAVVSLNKKLPVAVVIEDADVHETLFSFFEQLWERSALA